jgi:hypothetical protein
MIEDDFYATVKLKTGEEVFAKVAATEEEERTFLLLTYPVIVSEVKGRNGVEGYKVEPWLKTTSEDMIIINMNDVLTIVESSDIEMISIYQKYSRQLSFYDKNLSPNQKKLSKKMGYVANINDAKELLEKIFKSS